MAEVRTRFAPSPTGYVHVGSLRTAAYAYALAKHEHGEFLLRIEDTDQKREVNDATEKIFEILKKFDLVWDGEPVIQSLRAEKGVYRDAALKLIAQGNAYYCDCAGRNAKVDGFSDILRDPCRDAGKTEGAIRLKVPENEKISYYDFVLRKDVSWDSKDVPDTVLLKSDGQLATYHLAQAVDDHEFNISHVIRAVEWISSTPIHVLVHRYLDYTLPQIGHPSDILDPAGGKLSKRKGNVSVEQFLAEGYLSEALLNFVILLGWAPKDNRELFTLQEFVEAFDENGFQKSNPVFNTTKLDWFNGYYIRLKSDEELYELVKPFTKYPVTIEMIKLIKERISKLTDVDPLVKFFFEKPEPVPGLNKEYLESAFEWIGSNHDLAEMARSKGWKLGDFFMTLRLAVTGQKITPPLNESMVILGEAEVLNRLKLYL
jgi:glutamyl-tRNA synthetase